MTFSCRETVYKLLIDILTCLLIPFSKTMNEKRLCQSLNDLLPHLIQSLEFLVPHKPCLSSSASVPPPPLSVLSSDLHSHQPIKYPGRDSALAEGCLGYEMTSVYIRHRSCLPATHRQYIWQRGEDSAELMDEDIPCPAVMKRDTGEQANGTVLWAQ